MIDLNGYLVGIDEFLCCEYKTGAVGGIFEYEIIGSCGVYRKQPKISEIWRLHRDCHGFWQCDN